MDESADTEMPEQPVIPMIHTHQGPPPADEALPEVTEMLIADEEARRSEEKKKEQEAEQSTELNVDSKKAESSQSSAIKITFFSNRSLLYAWRFEVIIVRYFFDAHL